MSSNTEPSNINKIRMVAQRDSTPCSSRDALSPALSRSWTVFSQRKSGQFSNARWVASRLTTHDIGCRLDGFDHRPTELRQVEWRLPSLHSTPVRAEEHWSRCSSLAVTTIEDNPHLTRVPKLTVKQFIPVEPSARHDEDDHAVLVVLAAAPSRRDRGLITSNSAVHRPRLRAER